MAPVTLIPLTRTLSLTCKRWAGRLQRLPNPAGSCPQVSEPVPDQAPVITIDLPGGSGRVTVSLRLAELLGWHLLDSGALYRLVAVAALQEQLPLEDEVRLGHLAASLDAGFTVTNREIKVMLNGQDVSQQLRSEEV